MLRGIDVSHWNNENMDITGADFVICKATEGTDFIDNTFQHWMKRTDEMLRGCYHFAAGQNASVEAFHFFNVTRQYTGDFAPVLDFEINIDRPVEWVEAFVNRYYELTGNYCTLYISASLCNLFDDSWISDFCPLWVAGYPQPYFTRWINHECPYKVGAWGKPDIWQFTSMLDFHNTKVDANIAYMSDIGFQALYGVSDMTESELKAIKMHTAYGDYTFGEIIPWIYSYVRDMQPVVFDLKKRVEKIEKMINDDND